MDFPWALHLCLLESDVEPLGSSPYDIEMDGASYQFVVEASSNSDQNEGLVVVGAMEVECNSWMVEELLGRKTLVLSEKISQYIQPRTLFLDRCRTLFCSAEHPNGAPELKSSSTGNEWNEQPEVVVVVVVELQRISVEVVALVY